MLLKKFSIFNINDVSGNCLIATSALCRGRVALPNRMNFRKSAKGGGVNFNPKIYVADFWNFRQGFLIMKLIQNSNFRFRLQGMFFFSTIVSKGQRDG